MPTQNGYQFFTANITCPKKHAEAKQLVQKALESDSWTSDNANHRKYFSADAGRHNQVCTSRSFSVPHVRLKTDLSSKLSQLKQLTHIEKCKVDLAYDRIVSELIDFFLYPPLGRQRSLNELSQLYDADTMQDITNQLKALNNLKLDYYTFESDVENFCSHMSALMARCFSQEKILKLPLRNLYLFLLYQTNNPGVFAETLKEKFVRYLCYTLKYISIIALVLSIGLIPMLTMILLGNTILSFTLTSLLIGAAGIGFYYLSGSGLSEAFFDSICNALSHFFFSCMESFFKCKTYEFELTRVLEKGSAISLSMPSQVAEVGSDQGKAHQGESTHGTSP